MSEKLNFKAQLEAFRTNAPEYVNDSYYFFDWFCSEKALKIKSKLLMTKAEKVMSKLGLDPETHRVFFKNNCPMSGKLYDSFSICTNDEKNDVVIWCTPSSGHKSTEGQAQLVDFRDYETREYTGKVGKEINCNSWKELTHKLVDESASYLVNILQDEVRYEDQQA
jgi:hypothetical protein